MSSGNVNSFEVIEVMIVSKSAFSNDVLPGPPGNSVSPVNSSGVSAERERDRSGGVAGVVDCVQPEAADLDHLGVVDEDVVADLAEHGSVERRDGDLVAGLAHGGDRLDVIPVTVGFEHSLDAETLAQLEELFVLVGGVEQHRFARREAAHDEHVVLIRPDHHLVDLDVSVRPVQRFRSSHRPSLAARPRDPIARRVARGECCRRLSGRLQVTAR